MGVFDCPECNTEFDTDDKNSGHQVNDYFDLTFCSYACSCIHAVHHIRDNLDDLDKETIEHIVTTV